MAIMLINLIEAIVLCIRDIGLALTRPKYLHNDPDDYKALPFETVLRRMKTKLKRGNDQWNLTTEYENEERITTILALNNFDPKKPTLIYHHGAGSTHPLRDFDVIFGEDFKQKFNVFVVWAQFHRTKKEYIANSVDSFIHHQETFAGSVMAYEEIVKYHRAQSQLPVVATGSSMGGIVSALHAFYFGSADYYFPLVAYPNVGEIFLSDAYKNVVSNLEKKRQNKSYFNSFVIKDIDKNLTKKIFPILGTRDKIVESQRAIKFWEERGFSVTKYPYGHFTPGVMRKKIRKMILKLTCE